MWDAYTVTDRYPNAQPLADEPIRRRELRAQLVKVVVDAYEGTVDFYIADETDPIIAAYARIFPNLFQPLSAMSDELIAHLRYPEDLFTAQNLASRVYHLPATDTGATTFYNQDDRWAIPLDVSTAQPTPMEPYYVTMRIPGEDEAGVRPHSADGAPRAGRT